MVRGVDAADALGIALVTAMLDRSGAESDSRRQAAHIATMITDARLGVDPSVDEYIGALEPVALWLDRWLSGS